MRTCAIIHPLHVELETAQPNKPDRPNRPNELDKPADFFSILLAK